nr:serine/threonine-protein phosphatase [Streptomyces sp. RPA4-2]
MAGEVASRYRPTDMDNGVGGDWFDVIPLPGAQVALVVGDVVGHGLQAAATMGRLRTAVHTLADMDLAPDELLAHLDDTVQRLAGWTHRCHGPAPGGGCDLPLRCLRTGLPDVLHGTGQASPTRDHWSAGSGRLPRPPLRSPSVSGWASLSRPWNSNCPREVSSLCTQTV